MTDRIVLVSLVVSVLLLLTVLELIRRRKLAEEYSFVWIFFAAALIVLSLRKNLLDRGARWLGVYYPPVVLLLVVVLMGFVGSLWFAVIVSKQRRQIERLIEETAVLSAEVRELKDEGRAADRVGAPPGQDRTGPPGDRVHPSPPRRGAA